MFFGLDLGAKDRSNLTVFRQSDKYKASILSARNTTKVFLSRCTVLCYNACEVSGE